MAKLEVDKKGFWFITGLLVFSFLAKNKTNDDPNNTGGGGISFITDNEAKNLAERIKKAIGYITIDWKEIAAAFSALKHDKDVEQLYKAFGTYDGALYINGDLFNVLNKAAVGAFKSVEFYTIKTHCFNYAKWLKF